jgi:hypothetical protein
MANSNRLSAADPMRHDEPVPRSSALGMSPMGKRLLECSPRVKRGSTENTLSSGPL